MTSLFELIMYALNVAPLANCLTTASMRVLRGQLFFKPTNASLVIFGNFDNLRVSIPKFNLQSVYVSDWNGVQKKQLTHTQQQGRICAYIDAYSI